MKHECQPFELLASRSLDDQLDPTDALALAGHLEACPACRAALVCGQRVRGAMGGALTVRDAASRKGEALRLVDRAQRRERSLVRRLRVVLLAAPALALATFAVESWLWQPLIGVTIYAVLVVAWRGHRSRSLARIGAASADLLAVIERGVRRRRLLSVPVALFALTLGTLWFATGFVQVPDAMRDLGFRNAGVFGLLVSMIFVGFAVYELSVVRPRLTRELEMLTAR